MYQVQQGPVLHVSAYRITLETGVKLELVSIAVTTGDIASRKRDKVRI